MEIPTSKFQDWTKDEQTKLLLRSNWYNSLKNSTSIAFQQKVDNHIAWYKDCYTVY